MKKKFIDEPGQMKLLIVVDKLLTGFDAPPATYLYIDKQMRDHGLFQAICRVNRLDGDDKEYGYIIDYKDLFKSLEGAVQDYTSGALDGYDKEDVAGLLEDRLGKARERLEETREAVRALCEPVEAAEGHGGLSPLLLREGFRQRRAAQGQRADSAWRSTSTWRPTFGPTPTSPTKWRRPAISPAEIEAIKAEVDHYEKVRNEVKLASGDYIDLKMYEPAMRHLIDTYIHAEESEKVSAFDDMSLVQLIVERGAGRGRRAARGHPEEPGGRGRDDREQRPQADHRRAADQPEVLREDVGAAGRPDRPAAGRRPSITRSTSRRSWS